MSAKRFVIGGGPETHGPDAFEAFRSLVANLYAATLPAPSPIDDFRFGLTSVQLVSATLWETSATALRLERGREGAPGRNGDVVVCLLLEGDLRFTTRDQAVRMRGGDIVILDHAHPVTLSSTGFRTLALRTKRDRVPTVLREGSAHGTVLPHVGAAAQLVGGQLLQLFRLVDALDLLTAEAAVDALLTVVAGALTATRSQEVSDNDNELSEDRKRKALAFIDASLDDPALTPQHVAQHLGYSRSTIYRLFSDEDGLRGVIMRRRLDASLGELLGAHPRKPLREIAQACGFQSEAHFSRSFRARFGLPPKRFSEAAARQDRSWFELQAGRAGLNPVDLDLRPSPTTRCA